MAVQIPGDIEFQICFSCTSLHNVQQIESFLQLGAVDHTPVREMLDISGNCYKIIKICLSSMHLTLRNFICILRGDSSVICHRRVYICGRQQRRERSLEPQIFDFFHRFLLNMHYNVFSEKESVPSSGKKGREDLTHLGSIGKTILNPSATHITSTSSTLIPNRG